MSLSDQEILELHELLDALVENNLAGERFRRLEDWLTESEAARRYYVRFMEMSAGLSHYAEERLSDEDVDDHESPDQDEGKLIRFVRPLLAVAAVLALGFLFLSSPLDFFRDGSENVSQTADSSSGQDSSNNSSIPFDAEAVGVLTLAAGLEWAADSEYRPDLQEPIRPGKLKLKSGLAQIEFLQGAYVVLEGPVEFELKTSNEGNLHYGKLRANVPQVAVGFTIDTPRGKVVDLGTEFGLNVKKDGITEIYVYVGKVLFEGRDRGVELAFEEIEAGEAVYINDKGELSWIDMPSEAFFGTADLSNRSMEEAQRRHAAWIDLSNELASDARTALYFSFDDHRSWSRMLRDDAKSEGKRHDGAIVGCEWSKGRWVGKGALSFDGENDRVHIDLPDHLESATLAAWVRLETLGSVMTPIICADHSSAGAGFWGIDGEGRLVLRAKAMQTNAFDTYVSSVAFSKERIGRWVHLATTYDAGNRMVSHYVNGRPFSREKMKRELSLLFAKSELGYSRYFSTDREVSALHGSIDEFSLHERAFEEEEIRRLYEIGRPYAMPPRLVPTFP
jgi:ferric-dicitrate binding protein FerR (iron transport regulator)